MSSEIKELANRVFDALAESGIAVALYASKSSNSVYLTLDYGVLKQVRVSDHKSSSYKYTFEIGTHIQTSRDVVRSFRGHPFHRHLFSADDVDGLVTSVLLLRRAIRSKYTTLRYSNILDIQMEKHISQRHLPRYLQSYDKMNTFKRGNK